MEKRNEKLEILINKEEKSLIKERIPTMLPLEELNIDMI